LPISEKEEEMKAKLYSNDLKRLVDATKKFTDKSMWGDAKLQYIHLAVDKDKETVTATALDGRRVSIEKAALIDCDESFECYIKPSLLQVKDDNHATIERVNDKAYITIGGNITGYHQPDGEFYQVDNLLKDIEVVQTIGVSAKLLKEALESVKATGVPVAIDIPKDPGKPIVIRHKGNKKIVLPARIANDDN